MRILAKGACGPDVEEIQRALAALGFYTPERVDRYYGPLTREAVRKFQESQGLHPDGIVGPATWAALVTADAQATHPAQPFPERPDFAPMGPAERGRIFGAYKYIRSDGDDITILGTWEQDNIVSVPIPALAGIPDPIGRPGKGVIRIHRLAVRQFVNFFEAVEGLGLRKLLLTFDGAFCPRLIRNGKGLSNHAFGTAIDLNYQWNKMGKGSAPAGTEGSVWPLVPVAHRFGIYWGGHFERDDGMHFEIGVAM